MTLKLVATEGLGRDNAIATCRLSSGEVALTDNGWKTALLASEKGKRCDLCHRAASEDITLRKCTKCAEYWYCGPQCQSVQWKLDHRLICKTYHSLVSSTEFRKSDEYQRTDAVLLAHAMASPALRDAQELQASLDDKRDLESLRTVQPARLCLELLPAVESVSKSSGAEQETLSREIYSRFKNNNFVLHSHLNPGYAHGLYPLASRFLNHSCVPNAAPRFVLQQGHLPRMEVIALKNIGIGEEVTIPYVDPATPYASRAAALRSSYGFICRCPLCETSRERGWTAEDSISPLPTSTEGLRSFGNALQGFTFDSEKPTRLRREPMLFKSLPDSLAAAMNPTYLPALSEAFGQSSHDGPLADALEVGRTLLALYRVIYPAMFPMIGLHALELAKVAWNAVCIGLPKSDEQETRMATEYERDMLALATGYVDIAKEILSNYGGEGDVGGPLTELNTLQVVMDE